LIAPGPGSSVLSARSPGPREAERAEIELMAAQEKAATIEQHAAWKMPKNPSQARRRPPPECGILNRRSSGRPQGLFIDRVVVPGGRPKQLEIHWAPL